MKLSGQQQRILREAILGAYPNPDDLKILLSEQMDVKIDVIARGDAYNAKVFSLIEEFEADGRIEKFIQAVMDDKPNSHYLKTIKSNLPDSFSVNLMTLFQLNYGFARQVVEMDNDSLVQFVVTFTNQDNQDNQDISQVNIAKHICLILDVSQSRNTSDKYPYLLQAIPCVLNTLSEYDWISIILFSSRSELIWSNSIANSRIHEKDIIQRIEQSGIKFEQTFLAPGLRIALHEIQSPLNKFSSVLNQRFALQILPL